jgi:hypothetical protein
VSTPPIAVGLLSAMVAGHLVLVEWCSGLGSSSCVRVGLALYECGRGPVGVVVWFSLINLASFSLMDKAKLLLSLKRKYTC